MNESKGQLAWRYVTDAAQLRDEVAKLLGEQVLGLDTETYWEVKAGRSHVSLMQVAPPAGEVLVADVLATGVEPLKELIESPGTKLVAHNARFDEMVLRNMGLEPRGLVDTLQMSRMAVSLASHSLASVTEHLFGTPLDKTLQKSNWRRRPLTPAQIEYAAKDARVTLNVYEELRRLLEAEGRWELALRASEIKTGGPSKARRKRPALPQIILTPEEKRVVSILKKWRLERANLQRVPAYMICPDRTLEQLARERPSSLEALASIYGLGESKIKNFGEDLLEALIKAAG